METLSSTPTEDSNTSEVIASRSKRLLLTIGLSVAGISLVLSGVCAWGLHRINGKLDDLSFQQTASDYSHDNDLLSPDIGVIQFMHKGYSITFNTLTYTASGLEIAGTIGNPNQITVSSLNLKLSARPFLYKNRDKIVKDPFFMFTGGSEIGSGQATISYLMPGRTDTFTMTIPNVKQTPDGFQILVSFSGERYSY
jgi:hypothetical protein